MRSAPRGGRDPLMALVRQACHRHESFVFALDDADLLEPPVTVVSYDPELIGRTAGELLLRRMAGDQAPPRRVEVPVRLIARGS